MVADKGASPDSGSSLQWNGITLRHDPVDEPERTKWGMKKLSKYTKLFRYASYIDWLLMFFGAIAAMIQGSSIPMLVFSYGKILAIFVNQFTTSNLYAVVSDNSANCSGAFPMSNMRVEDAVAALNNGSELLDCDYFIASNDTYGDIIQGCYGGLIRCLDNESFFTEVNNFVYIILFIAFGALVSGALAIFLFQATAEKIIYKMRLNLYQSILRQEIGWFDMIHSGELASILFDDINRIQDGIGDQIAYLITWTTTALGGVALGFATDWKITLFALGLTPFIAASLIAAAKFTSKFAALEQKEYASAGNVAEEALSAIRTVLAFGGEKIKRERYEQKLARAKRIGIRRGLAVGISYGIELFLLLLEYASVFWYGGYLVALGMIHPGDVTVPLLAVILGSYALGATAKPAEYFSSAATIASDVFRIIDRKPTIKSMSKEYHKLQPSIQFIDICFSYPTRPEIQVLDGLSLCVEEGKTVALVGPSGCGKSTVLQLLLRFFDPDEGQILLGGRDIVTLNLDWLRKNIGLVSQEPVLFDTTVIENIRFGKEDATMAEVVQAAKTANIHNFIKQLPNGYHTVVGEGGIHLSGGQKQRIAIARALVRNPQILILDEATSALDVESEKEVQEALDRGSKDRTTIVIAHRLSTVRNADLIIAIKEGTATEVGTHEELMAKQGLYHDLVTAQVGSEAGLPSQCMQRTVSSFSRQSNTMGALSNSPQEKRDDTGEDLQEVPLKRLLYLSVKEWWIIVLGIAGATITGTFWPLFGLLYGEVLEAYTSPSELVLELLHPYTSVMIGVGAVIGVAVFVKEFCFSVSGEQISRRIRSQTFGAMLQQEIGWFDKESNSTSTLTTILTSDTGNIQAATGSQIGILLEAIAAILLSLLISLVYSWSLTCLIVGVLPFLLAGGYLQGKAGKYFAVKKRSALEQAGKIAVESFENIRTVTAFSSHEILHKKYKERLQKPIQYSLINKAIYGLMYGFSQSILYITFAILIRYGAFQVTRPPSHVAYTNYQDIFRVIATLTLAAKGAGKAVAFIPFYTKGRISANRVFSILDRQPHIHNYDKEGTKLESVCGEIGIQNVSFTYPTRPQVPILNGLSLSAKSGKTLALVGPSGGGKTTVTSLIARFYDNFSGKITLDGTDLKELNLPWLRSQIGIVFQEPVLFDSSIADNIRYGANFREVSDEEVIEAAKLANIHDFIVALPQGYRTNAGGRNVQLSGGQKQRIAIARALVRHPKILLLDEATSALDTESEKVVQEALNRAREGRTTIIIAHRLSTIYSADCIGVLKEGKVAELGTQQLLDKKDIYYTTHMKEDTSIV